MPVKPDKTDTNKKKFLKALEECNGIVMLACKATSLSRSNYYEWCQNDAAFKVQVDDIQEVAIDFVESKLIEKISGISVVGGDGEIYTQPPSDTAIIFYLKTKGKKRGYVERSEVDNMGKETVVAPIVNVYNNAPPLASSEKEVDA